nr:hypothetical protein [Tanacetum cinerariifolium]
MEILLLNAHLVVHCYDMQRVCEEQPIPVPMHTHFVVVEVRWYNCMFAFTSMGGKQDTSVNVGRGPYCYQLHGENYHLAGPLWPADGKPKKFAQLYIFDTENEIQNKIAAVSNGESSSSRNNELDYQLTTEIRDLLDEINPQRDGRQYNLPTTSEVAALIVGDFDSMEHKRDIILHC